MLSFLPLDEIEVVGLEHDDKLLHAAAYIVMVVLLFFSLKIKSFNTAILASASMCMAYGVVVEILQPIISHKRVFDYYDILANGIGIVVGVLILIALKLKLKSNKPLLY